MLPVLVSGAIGGVLPTVARLAATYVAVPTTAPPAFGLLLGLALFAFIGAGVAFGTGSKELRQALMAGIAAPGIITNLVAGADVQRRGDVDPNLRTAWATGLISAAHAQQSEPTQPQAESSGFKSITIDPRVSGGLPSATNIPVTAEVAGGPNSEARKVQIGTINSLQNPTKLITPLGTSSITIGDQTVPLTSAENRIDLGVSTMPAPGSDFIWALGGQRSFTIDRIAPKVDAARPNG